MKFNSERTELVKTMSEQALERALNESKDLLRRQQLLKALWRLRRGLADETAKEDADFRPRLSKAAAHSPPAQRQGSAA